MLYWKEIEFPYPHNEHHVFKWTIVGDIFVSTAETDQDFQTRFAWVNGVLENRIPMAVFNHNSAVVEPLKVHYELCLWADEIQS